MWFNSEILNRPCECKSESLLVDVGASCRKTMADRSNNKDTEDDSDAGKEAWGLSKSKAILRTGLLNGTIKPHMKPKEVFNMNPQEHGKWNYNNWANNLRNLRNSIKRDRGRMQKDVLAYGHDLAIVNEYRKSLSNPKPRWRGSSAERLLKQDIDEGKHLSMKPRFLHQTRSEYRIFDLMVFRKHIYQEVDSRPKREMRFQRKKKNWKYPELHKDHPRLQDQDNQS